ncbi:MAG: hypothetical protein ORN52_09950 [Beijerinckiaceae bacterium]|nr:hypothetical protein [Beijerinckiaceae bacterium]
MAGSSDGEEVNYWPGFVDALSTMTMMLIFLMMILSLVVVNISQSSSKSQILAIAKAAKVDSSGAPMSIDKMTAQILEALSRKSDPPNANLPVTEAKPQKETIIAEPSTLIKIQEDKNFSIEEGQKVASHGVNDSLISNGKSATAGTADNIGDSKIIPSNPPTSSQTAELDPEAGKYYFASPTQNPDNKRIVSRRPADIRPFGGSTDVKTNKALITIEYQPRAVRVDEASASKLTELVSSRKNQLADRTLQVRAFANVQNGNVTEARRYGYYRAMALRQFLVDAGFPADQIRVGIEDITNQDLSDIVELFAL